jgi:beta-phosphoglucomutase
MNHIRAIIFDMDGVLIDAKEWHYEALNRALELFGYTIHREEHLGRYNGLPTAKKLEMLSIDRQLPRSLHRFINTMKQKYTLELVEALCRPRFHHEYALSRLKREGYILGLASNSIRDTCERMMDLSGLGRHLNFMLSNQDVTRPKPDPEIYLAAVVEDNQHGIEAAQRAGANVLEVQTVEDVNYDNIRRFINQIESAKSRSRAVSREAA